MPSKDQWEALDLGFTVGPPHAKRPRGRPKKQRIRGIDEEDVKRKVSNMFLCVHASVSQFLCLRAFYNMSVHASSVIIL